MRRGSSECLGPTGTMECSSLPSDAPKAPWMCPSGFPALLTSGPLSSTPSRDIILESIPTDNPEAHSNLYILTGHQSSY